MSIQNIGASGENSFLVRLGGTTQLTPESAAQARTAIEGLGGIKSVYPDVANGIINFRSGSRWRRTPCARRCRTPARA